MRTPVTTDRCSTRTGRSSPSEPPPGQPSVKRTPAVRATLHPSPRSRRPWRPSGSGSHQRSRVGQRRLVHLAARCGHRLGAALSPNRGKRTVCNSRHVTVNHRRRSDGHRSTALGHEPLSPLPQHRLTAVHPDRARRREPDDAVLRQERPARQDGRAWHQPVDSVADRDRRRRRGRAAARAGRRGLARRQRAGLTWTTHRFSSSPRSVT